MGLPEGGFSGTPVFPAASKPSNALLRTPRGFSPGTGPPFLMFAYGRLLREPLNSYPPGPLPWPPAITGASTL